MNTGTPLAKGHRWELTKALAKWSSQKSSAASRRELARRLRCSVGEVGKLLDGGPVTDGLVRKACEVLEVSEPAEINPR